MRTNPYWPDAFITTVTRKKSRSVVEGRTDPQGVYEDAGADSELA
jgi:hypothetical protein